MNFTYGKKVTLSREYEQEKFKNHPHITGRVIGVVSVPAGIHTNPAMNVCFVVRLDNGFYDVDGRMYIRDVLVHTDSIMEE